MAADTPPAPEKSSVLLYGGTVISLDVQNPALCQCEMLVQRGVVASLGRSLTLMPGTRLLDITGHVVIPGLVASGGRLLDAVLDELVEPGEEGLKAALDDESAYALALYGAIMALQNGVTTVRDDSASAGSDGLRRAFGESGLRVAAGRDDSRRTLGLDSLRGQPNAHAALVDATLDAARQLELAGELGSLAVGKWADLVVLSIEGGQLDGADNERLAELALSADAKVRHVLIAGAHAVADGRAVRHDLEALRMEARGQVARLRG